MNKKLIRLTESDLKQIVKKTINRVIKESNELDANNWKDRLLKYAHYPNEPVDMKDIENKASWETFDDNINSLYGERGCYDDDYASQAYADDPLSDFYGLENKNTYDLKGYLAKRKLNKLAKNESKDMNKKLIRLTESDLHNIVKESVNRILKEANDHLLSIGGVEDTPFTRNNNKGSNGFRINGAFSGTYDYGMNPASVAMEMMKDKQPFDEFIDYCKQRGINPYDYIDTNDIEVQQWIEDYV